MLFILIASSFKCDINLCNSFCAEQSDDFAFAYSSKVSCIFTLAKELVATTGFKRVETDFFGAFKLDIPCLIKSISCVRGSC
jgi:hypothetical protein